jgi:hypothetical protein
MSRQVRGPQDLTVDDNASEVVERIFIRLGGERDELKAIHWVRVLRPWSTAARVAAEALGRPRAARLLGAAAAPLDALTIAAAGPLLAVRTSDADGVALTPALLLEHCDAVLGADVLRPDWDEPFLTWLWGELGRVPARGRFVGQLVLGTGDRPLGWYLYYLRPGWRSEVLQVAARPRDRAAVVDHLLAHAAAHGSAAVRGRLDPGMLPALVGRTCLYWHRGGSLVHARDPELRAAVHADGALLSRLDGDWYSNALV